MKPQQSLIIAGPTASGKSSLAVALAERLGGTVINADSMQIYRELAIVTARPRGETLDRAPHRLYGVLDIRDRCTAGRWRSMALKEIRTSRKHGRIPILVGGSGLYLYALTHGLHSLPSVPPRIRGELKERLEREGVAGLYAELQTRDPETAAGIGKNDQQRIVRALEVIEHTGRGLSRWYGEGERLGDSDSSFLTILVMPPRAELQAACDRRFLAMLDAGAVAEVERFREVDSEKTCPLWKAVGVQPISDHLDGSLSRNQMIARAQRDTRRYAKRQVTWFRHRTVADVLVQGLCGEDSADRICQDIAEPL